MARQSIKVFAPATVANVAVGYDILGFAIHGPGDEVIIKRGGSPGLSIVEITGAKGKLPLDPRKNTAGVAAISFLESVGAQKEPLEMTIRKKMPFGSGLGSSAASAVAGVFAAHEILKLGMHKRALLKYAVMGEQAADGAWHADNVAPSLLGGMVFVRDNTTLDVHKLYIPKGLLAIVIYPHIQILTKESRNILKKSITLKDHTQQAGNLGGLIMGMYNSDFDLIRRSLDDIIIEPQRKHLIPYFDEIKKAAIDSGALGFSISGAGPSMFALAANTKVIESIKEKAEKIYFDAKIRVNIYISEINQEGAILF